VPVLERWFRGTEKKGGDSSVPTSIGQRLSRSTGSQASVGEHSNDRTARIEKRMSRHLLKEGVETRENGRLFFTKRDRERGEERYLQSLSRCRRGQRQEKGGHAEVSVGEKKQNRERKKNLKGGEGVFTDRRELSRGLGMTLG